MPAIFTVAAPRSATVSAQSRAFIYWMVAFQRANYNIRNGSDSMDN